MKLPFALQLEFNKLRAEVRKIPASSELRWLSVIMVVITLPVKLSGCLQRFKDNRQDTRMRGLAEFICLLSLIEGQLFKLDNCEAVVLSQNTVSKTTMWEI
ncbi:vacuolar protein sorting-associated protein 8-like protein [Platysternon megacephalum]|uniref:Vacuolar protein sorting-associated protein 8-like protein n=1 Tax=Platysternon megacephalum TaxID=55544 RepID=A0A4D9EF25_9SAUR|nr:vacuolar protein sorting-associated protein 8-like protein [Platysternon megacephalum]